MSTIGGDRDRDGASVLVEGGERTPLLKVTHMSRDGSLASERGREREREREREADGPTYGAIGLSESPKP